MITYGPTRYTCAGWPKNARSESARRPPADPSGLAMATTKSARCVAGAYQSTDASQGRTALPLSEIGATSTLPPVSTVVLFACQ